MNLSLPRGCINPAHIKAGSGPTQANASSSEVSVVTAEAFPNKPGGVCSSKPKAPARPAGNTGFLTFSVPKTLKLHQSKLGSGEGKCPRFDTEMNCPGVAASYFMKMEIILPVTPLVALYLYFIKLSCVHQTLQHLLQPQRINLA